MGQTNHVRVTFLFKSHPIHYQLRDSLSNEKNCWAKSREVRYTKPISLKVKSLRKPPGAGRTFQGLLVINDLWYKNAIIYCLSVGTFLDTNADGIGDFQGAASTS